jgi:hypothetical protein
MGIESEKLDERILFNFLFFLTEKGYITDYDFDFEKEIKLFIKKTTKDEQNRI